jgi:hypothetical protein
MLPYTLLATLLVAVTVAMHAIGTLVWLRYLVARYSVDDDRVVRTPGVTIRMLVESIVFLLVLHSLEIIVWALAYLHLLPPNVLESFEEATYFSFVTFTTLGYGDITLAEAWRIMSGIEALNGIILVGWSTAMLFALVQQTWRGLLTAKTAENAEN